MDKKRLTTALLLAFMFSLFMLWDAWERAHKPASPAPAASVPQAATTAAAVPAAPVASANSVTGQAAVPTISQAPKAAAPAADAPRLKLRTDVLALEISAQGGDIVYAELLRHRATLDADKNFVLFQNTPEHVYVAQSGLIGDSVPNHKTLFDIGRTAEYALKEGEDTLTVRLVAPVVNGVAVTKVYTLKRGSYQVDVAYEVNNRSAAALTPYAYFQLLRDEKQPESSTDGAFGVTTFTGPALYTDAEKFQKAGFEDIAKGKANYAHKANNGWIGLVQHYFFSAWLPQGATEREFYIDKLGDLYRAGVKLPFAEVAAGSAATFSTPLYVGPQEQTKLAAIAPGLDLVVDYGALTVIADPLFWVMQKLHAMIGNWGWTIILLTVLLKLAFFPLSATSYKSMAKMKQVMPQMTRLKETYKDDRAKLNLEMMELYKREKINPLGGCLPVVVQIPVFIALYWVLLGTVEMRNAPWLGWITDLSVKDPYYILPIIMGATMFFQTRLNPTPPDPVQAKLMTWMPVMFTVMFLWFPSGLVLYWVVNNVLSIAQQWHITRQIEGAGK